jgi:hypothetical protein
MQKKLEALCKDFKPITLKEMDSVKLMDRLESKFLLHRDLLPLILKEVHNDYQILEIEKQRVFPYSSLYYDTEDDCCYQSHHRGKSLRYKIRYRKYLSSNQCFFEIKQKCRGDRTVKKRIEIKDIETNLSDIAKEYIKKITPFQHCDLKPKIYTDFSRITLVSTTNQERATIDLDVHFKFNGNSHIFDNLVIIEVKRSTSSPSSSMLIKTLRSHRVVAGGMSKYCIGRAMIEKQLKYNNFKEGIKHINKINDGKYYYINFDKH